MAVNKKLTRGQMIEILDKARERYPDGSYVYDDDEILALFKESKLSKKVPSNVFCKKCGKWEKWCTCNK